MNPIIALNLIECVVTLYPADGTGAPILASPIWTGVWVENLTVKERWIKVETKPTGARYPRKHPLIQQYELNLGRVWSLELPTTDGGWVVTPQKHVLDIVWQDGDSADWHREVFYNVTISDRSKTSRDIDGGFTDEQVFEAEYMAPPTGGSGTVPAITSALPMVVRYVPLGGNSLGAVDLYVYDPTAHTFTEASTGISTSRATLAYSGSGGAAVFNVTFSGSGSPALQMQSDGVLAVTALQHGVPGTAQTPRLEFYYGQQRVASVSAAGTLWAAAFTNDNPTDGTGKFALYGGGVLRATLSGVGVMSAEFEEDFVALALVILPDGAGGFWRVTVDAAGNVGAQSDSGPATPDVILADGAGGFWKMIADVTGLRACQSAAGPATAAPTAGGWTVGADSVGNVIATS